MITGHFSALDVLVLTPPALAAVHLLLPYTFTVRPVMLGRRLTALAGVWALAVAVAFALPPLSEAFFREMGIGQSSLIDSVFFTAVVTAVVTAAVAGSAVAVARACRRHVQLRPVAAAELPVLRAILADADGPKVDSGLEWAADCLQEAETDLRSGHGAAAVWQLHSAAKALSEDGGEAGRRAAAVRDRLRAAGRQHRVFGRTSGYYSAV